MRSWKLAESGPEKILGMRWIPKSDMFEFQVKINFSSKPEIIQCLIENHPNASIVSVS
jgi:hypothetical protein